MEKVGVTVVIPCFNQAHFLKDCIDSLRAQTEKVAEIIVIDDGSPDNTSEVANKLGVRCIRQTNKGLSAARNTGIRAAKTEYVLPLDADDMLHPDFLAKTLPYMERYDIVSTWLRTFGNENRKWGSDKLEPTIGIMKSQNQINCCSLFSRSMWQKVGGYDEGMRIGFEDWEFWLRSMDNGFNIRIVPEYLFMYRRHGVSMFREAQKKRDEILDYMARKRSITGELIDVVIPLGKGSKSANNELRFCLRSIEQYLEGYRNIWIIGQKPKFLKNVNHISHEEYHPKSNNIYDKIKRACNIGEISDNFILFNDDYFLVEKVDAPTYPNYYSDDALKEVLNRPKPDPYRTLVDETMQQVNLIMKYADIHCPIVINKKAFLSQPYKRNTEHGLLVKSTYLHWSGLPTVKRQDSILRKPHTKQQIEDMIFTTDMISIHDEAINNEFIEWIEGKFPYHSKYEV
jgi:glycosyltransferase involved in cell wall biosynthesis